MYILHKDCAIFSFAFALSGRLLFVFCTQGVALGLELIGLSARSHFLRGFPSSIRYLLRFSFFLDSVSSSIQLFPRFSFFLNSVSSSIQCLLRFNSLLSLFLLGVLHLRERLTILATCFPVAAAIGRLALDDDSLATKRTWLAYQWVFWLRC